MTKPAQPSPRTSATRRPELPTTPPTVRQVILLAAGKVAATRGGLVPLGALVVAAWQLAPERFGLDLDGNRMKHPDASLVYPKLGAIDGLCALGWLALEGRRLYRVTPKGQRKLRALGAVSLEGAGPT